MDTKLKHDTEPVIISGITTPVKIVIGNDTYDGIAQVRITYEDGGTNYVYAKELTVLENAIPFKI